METPLNEAFFAGISAITSLETEVSLVDLHLTDIDTAWPSYLSPEGRTSRSSPLSESGDVVGPGWRVNSATGAPLLADSCRRCPEWRSATR